MNKNIIIIFALSIISAMALIYAQTWGASKISIMILWQIYIFNLFVFPHGMSGQGHLAPGETVTIMRLDPESYLIGMIICLMLSLILYTYLFYKLISKIYYRQK